MCHKQQVQCEQVTIHSDLTAKENDDLKLVTFVQYTLNELKELSQILGDFMFVDNCQPQ